MAFPFHVRIPGWCEDAQILVNGKPLEDKLPAGKIHVVKRTWADGDRLELRLPMKLRRSTWAERAAAIERGPLVFALRVEENWTDVNDPKPGGVPADDLQRGYRECRPASPWNFALTQGEAERPEEHFRVEVTDEIAPNPWTLATAPVVLHGQGMRLPTWQLNGHSAAAPPVSPVAPPAGAALEPIQLIPYGASTLRISGFPWLRE